MRQRGDGGRGGGGGCSPGCKGRERWRIGPLLPARSSPSVGLSQRRGVMAGAPVVSAASASVCKLWHSPKNRQAIAATATSEVQPLPEGLILGLEHLSAPSCYKSVRVTITDYDASREGLRRCLAPWRRRHAVVPCRASNDAAAGAGRGGRLSGLVLPHSSCQHCPSAFNVQCVACPARRLCAMTANARRPARRGMAAARPCTATIQYSLSAHSHVV